MGYMYRTPDGKSIIMRIRLFLLLAGLGLCGRSRAQLSVHYDPTIQSTGNIQYFKPQGNLFVGDCIPFYHNHTYYLYWLLDSAHHKALGGLGGHQWALSTSTDLKTWVQHPVVLGIDEVWEKSICTGSVEFYKGKFYAFYATRLIDPAGKVNEQLSYAISDDGIHFVKQKPNPFYTSAPGYSKRNFRDPKVVIDPDGTFHLFVASSIDSSLTHDNGALVHLVSKDLKNWTVKKPLIYGQADVPECPDYFQWKGWWYLIYGRGGNTFYLKSRHPYGPWEYPRYQALNEDWINVAKTAEFNGGRRIVAGWIPSRRDGVDNGREIFGGNIALRELGQDPDGTLSTSFPAEAVPAAGAPIALHAVHDSLTVEGAGAYSIRSTAGMGAVFFSDLPPDCSISFDADPAMLTEEYGCFLKSDAHGGSGYRLSFSADNAEVGLAETHISAVNGLSKKVSVRIIMKGDIIDVCIGNRRCIVDRLYEQKGSWFGLYAKHGAVAFSNLTIAPLKP
jgi:beta-fructofuranosidase